MYVLENVVYQKKSNELLLSESYPTTCVEEHIYSYGERSSARSRGFGYERIRQTSAIYVCRSIVVKIRFISNRRLIYL